MLNAPKQRPPRLVMVAGRGRSGPRGFGSFMSRLPLVHSILGWLHPLDGGFTCTAQRTCIANSGTCSENPRAGRPHRFAVGETCLLGRLQTSKRVRMRLRTPYFSCRAPCRVHGCLFRSHRPYKFQKGTGAPGTPPVPFLGAEKARKPPYPFF